MNAMASPLVITIRTDAGTSHVTVVGTVDEQADLSALEALRGAVELDLGGVRRFNSVGVRYWMDVLRDVATRCQLTYVSCSRAVVEQLNMITGFLASGTVRTFSAPMRCEPCDRDQDHVFDRAEVIALDGLPAVRCSSCGLALELDDLEDSYLLFLREPTKVGSI